MARNKGKLSEAHKRFLVKCFAQGLSGQKAAHALEKAYGVKITKQTAEFYDPESGQSNRTDGRSGRLRQDLRDLYVVERKAFEEELKGMPTVKRAVRIRMREQAALMYEESRNYLAMTKLLNDIADEVGNVRTNKREITGKDGGPIETLDWAHFTDEELQAELLRQLTPPKPKPKK